MQMNLVVREDGDQKVGIYAFDDPEFFRVMVVYDDGKHKKFGTQIRWFDPDDGEKRDTTERPDLILTLARKCLYEIFGKRPKKVMYWLTKFQQIDFLGGWSNLQ